MSRLDELLKELCPNGVEYKTIEEIAVDIYRGSGIKRDELTESGLPCVRYGEIYTTYDVWFDKCVSHTKEENVKSPKYFEEGDILFAITGESVEDIAKSTAYVGKERCLAGGDIVVLKHNQNPKYLAYALSTYDAQKQKSAGKVKSKVVHSSVPAIKAISLPVPPLEVQREVVQILDKFTFLSSELTARRKQYEYYRNSLLTFNKEIPCVKLKEVATIERGTRVVRNQLEETGTYPVYQNALTPMGYYSGYNRLRNNTFMICAGAAGQIGYAKTDFWAADDCYTFKCKNDLDNKYLYYVRIFHNSNSLDCG